jgi:SAM-dependent methyltransferase
LQKAVTPMPNKTPKDIRSHNRQAWDKQVEWGTNPWTIPVGPEGIQAARRGEWTIYLTPIKTLPREWLPELPGKKVLCLASGGGQQGPVLAAAGAKVTVLDNSPRQLAQDRLVAEREGLLLETVEGDMADLSMFPDASFDYIVHPVSNVFVPDVLPVWQEAFRVLRRGGVLAAGFNNPAVYLFDYGLPPEADLVVRHKLPYSDAKSLSEAVKKQHLAEGNPLEFSHSLEKQIGGQTAAGFMITGFFEDNDDHLEYNPLGRYMPLYIATRAIKP